MLVKAIEIMGKSKPLSMPYKGVVVDNNDPKMLGRVKCTIQSIFEQVEDTSLLPWIFPESSAGLGGRNDSSFFAVPEIGSELVIRFPHESIYSGFYTGYWQSALTHQDMFNEDYPESYGFRDRQNTFWKVNKRKKSMEISHTSGSSIIFRDNGDIEISSKNNVVFSSSDGKTRQVYNMNEGTISHTPKEEVQLGGKKVVISSRECETKIGTEVKSVTGSSSTKISGGVVVKIGGSKNESIVNNRGVSISGNDSRLVTQQTEDTFGAGYSATVALGNYKIDQIAGNYDVAVKAGNVSISTLLGSTKMGNALASVSCSPVGGIVLDAKLTAEIKALVSTVIQGTVSAEIKSALIKLGAGTAPIVTTLSDPIEDYVTGRPKSGVPTILAG